MKYPKLPKRFKAKWVAALRSGKYKQNRTALFGDGAHCCLGVAGSICGVSDKSMDGAGVLLKEEGIDESKIPAALVGSCTSNPLVDALVKKNDRVGFRALATWIEKNL